MGTTDISLDLEVFRLDGLGWCYASQRINKGFDAFLAGLGSTSVIFLPYDLHPSLGARGVLKGSLHMSHSELKRRRIQPLPCSGSVRVCVATGCTSNKGWLSRFVSFFRVLKVDPGVGFSSTDDAWTTDATSNRTQMSVVAMVVLHQLVAS